MNILKQSSIYTMATIMVAGFYVPFAQADSSMPQPQQVGNITYITGGIGDEELNSLKAVKRNYNLSITNTNKSGAFVGDTHIIIRNKQGQELLSTDTEPLFYANLPKGHYVVESYSEGQSHKQPITIAENKPEQIHFSWK